MHQIFLRKFMRQASLGKTLDLKTLYQRTAIIPP